jgi:hypothetical protein
VVSVTPRAALLPPGSIVQEAGWASEPVWTQSIEKKILCPSRGSNPDRPVVQPVVRHYTAWANPAPKCFYNNIIYCCVLQQRSTLNGSAVQEVSVWNSGTERSAGMTYRHIPSNFEHCMKPACHRHKARSALHFNERVTETYNLIQQAHAHTLLEPKIYKESKLGSYFSENDQVHIPTQHYAVSVQYFRARTVQFANNYLVHNSLLCGSLAIVIITRMWTRGPWN